MVDGILTQILAQGFGGLLTNLATSYVNRSDRKIRQERDVIKRDLNDHLQVIFNKCMNVKTILNSGQASKTLEIYVDQRFSVNQEVIDQYSMIERIRSGQSVVILGEGGGGKSMFMRYLWLSYFEKSDGRIPFFLELRSINNLNHNNISDFIFHSIIKSGSTIRQHDFIEAIRSGEFVLFLDGFDEINFDRRDSVQKMILDLKENNPNLTIVVTSRSDERFIGWANFITANVLALNEVSSRLLIERSDYNSELKEQFLKKFEQLYSVHHDFLSNPLLAYMMLITFSHNPDIPRRMFQFYEQAFEALYHRHDLTKGYKRRFHCNIDKFDFIRLTSFFCLKTYYDQQIEFSKFEALEAIEQSKNIESLEFDSEHFLNDLVQSVCLLRIDGLSYTFTHRSFQEYFSAYCLARVASRNFDKLFLNFSKRYNDNVLPMVADINPDLFREKFILPNRKKFDGLLRRNTDRGLYESFAAKTGVVFELRLINFQRKTRKISKTNNMEGHISVTFSGELADFAAAVHCVAVNQGFSSSMPDMNKKHDDDFFDYARSILSDDHFPIQVIVKNGKIRFQSSSEDQSLNLTEQQENLLRIRFPDTMMKRYIEHRARTFIEFTKNEIDSYCRISDTFADLF